MLFSMEPYLKFYIRLKFPSIHYVATPPLYNQGSNHRVNIVLMNKLQKSKVLWGIPLFSERRKTRLLPITSITLFSQRINWKAVAFPQPRTSIASRFQWGWKIKVQIQLLFRVADLWVFSLLCVTPIEVPKEKAAGSCTKGGHHVFTKLCREAAIKIKWVPHL